MTDAEFDYVKLACIHAHSEELLTCLQAAVNGDPHWRLRAALVIDQIDHLQLPKYAPERMRELDGMRRAAEILGDIFADHKVMEDAVHAT